MLQDEKLQSLPEEEEVQESGLSTGAQLGIAAFFVGLPFLEMGVTAMGAGETGMILAGLAAGGLGVGTKVLIDQRHSGDDDDEDETPSLLSRIAAQTGILDRFQNADWSALFRPIGVPAPAQESQTEEPIDDPYQGFQYKGVQMPQHETLNETKVVIPAQFTLGRQTLDAIQEVNQKRFVYFGRTATRQVVLHIDEMYHVLDVAKSGRGKSNRFRNAMMQVVGLADTYYLNPFAAPVKSVTDDRKIEVWQPIYDRLANKRPVRESDEILQTLTNLVNEIERRSDLEQERDFSWREHPVFAFIDEVPEIYARCPDAVSLLDRIGRGGRQFGVFAWIATQSAQVKDIGLSTASQAQFKTLIYGGGDKTSGNRVMGVVTAEQEKALKTNGAGLTLMVADGLDDTEYVRAPLVTNEALFAFLGLPPFKIEEWLTPKSKQPVQDLSQFHPFTPAFTNDVPQAQNSAVKDVKASVRERRERVPGPNEAVILDALNALEEDEKPLTLNAITRKAGLTWRQAEEIEEAAFWYGYEIERGKGRPKEG